MTIIISLDGNIGAGKTTLLAEIRKRMKEVYVVDEPVAQWTALKNADGKNLLELFYEDKKRWAYTFQSCAIMTRIKNIRDAIMHTHLMGDINQVIITERSILTDKYVFAEMLRDSGDMDQMEWELYDSWFSTFNTSNKVSGIIYISTSSATSKERIEIRNRPGEEKISMEYLEALDEQHKKWVSSTELPVLTISTEPGSSVDITIKKIRDFIKILNKK